MGSSLEELIGSFRQQRAALLAQLDRNDVYRALSTLAPTARPELRGRLLSELASDKAYAALQQINDAIALLTGRHPDQADPAAAVGGDAATEDVDDSADDDPIAAPAAIATVGEPALSKLPVTVAAVASVAAPKAIVPFPLDPLDAEIAAHAIALAATQADLSCPEPIFTATEPIRVVADILEPSPLTQAAANGQQGDKAGGRRGMAVDGSDALPGSRLWRAEIDATVESIAFAVASITAGRQFGRGDVQEPKVAAMPAGLPIARNPSENVLLSQAVGQFIGEPAASQGGQQPETEAAAESNVADSMQNGVRLLRSPLAASIGPRPTRPPRGRPKVQVAAAANGLHAHTGPQRPTSTLEIALQPGHARRSAAWADKVMGKDRARPTLIGDKAGEAQVEIQRVSSANGRHKDARGIGLTDDGIATTRDAKPRIRRFLQALTGEDG